MAHAKKFSPSGAKRWMYCTAAPDFILEHGAPPKVNPAAEEGRAAHTILEYETLASDIGHRVRDQAKRLSLLVPEVVKLDEDENGFDVDQMREDAQYAIDMARVIVSESDDYIMALEQKVSIPKITKDCWGTADLILWSAKLNSLHVIDYKYGRVHVAADGNEQMMIYLLGALDAIGLTQFPQYMTLSIVQPRDNDPVRSWNVSPYYVMNTFLPRLKKAVHAIESGNTTFHASEGTCKYCPAIHACPAAEETVRKALGLVQPPEPPYEDYLEMVPVARMWCDAIEEAALQYVKDGNAIEGWGLKEGVSRRKWTNEEQVIDYLTKTKRLPLKEIAPRKLAGIPTIEKIISNKKGIDKSDLVAYITKPPGKLKLVREKTTESLTNDLEKSE